MDLARRLYSLSLQRFYCFPARPVPVEGVVVWRVVAELPKHAQDAGAGHQPHADSTEPDQVRWHALCLSLMLVGLLYADSTEPDQVLFIIILAGMAVV